MDPEIRNDADYRALPSIGGLIGSEAGRKLSSSYGEKAVINALRDAIAELRSGGMVSGDRDINALRVLAAAERMLSEAPGGLRSVINATGVAIHTNLGRAPLSKKAIAAAKSAAEGYTDLEYDLEGGKRGSRQAHGAPQAARILGAEAAIIVNNNAAAVLLCLDALAKGRKVAVSRGELVEIGGAFRVPEIMSATGAILMEVGTTNRTRASDFERAVDEGASALLKVHPSNFRVTGFTSEVSTAEMAEIAGRRSIPFIYDIGSGAMLPMSGFGLPEEPMPRAAIHDGADIVTFSGDKLLGGPQCGIVAGRKDLVTKVAASPLARAFRVDKMRLAAIAATLVQYERDGEWRDIPVLKMLSEGQESIRDRAAHLINLIREGLGSRADAVRLEIVETDDEVGGGSVPGATIRGAGVHLSCEGLEPREAARRLRTCAYPAVALERGSGLLLSMRTVGEDELERLASSVIGAVIMGEGR